MANTEAQTQNTDPSAAGDREEPAPNPQQRSETSGPDTQNDARGRQGGGAPLDDGGPI